MRWQHLVAPSGDKNGIAPPVTRARLDTTTNFKEGDRNWDKVSPKFSLVVVLPRPKSDAWFLLFVKVLRDRTDWSSPPDWPTP